jgi:hypothetical protein
MSMIAQKFVDAACQCSLFGWAGAQLAFSSPMEVLGRAVVVVMWGLGRPQTRPPVKIKLVAPKFNLGHQGLSADCTADPI